jgi:hypothetical protein
MAPKVEVRKTKIANIRWLMAASALDCLAGLHGQFPSSALE